MLCWIVRPNLFYRPRGCLSRFIYRGNITPKDPAPASLFFNPPCLSPTPVTMAKPFRSHQPSNPFLNSARFISQNYVCCVLKPNENKENSIFQDARREMTMQTLSRKSASNYSCQSIHTFLIPVKHKILSVNYKLTSWLVSGRAREAEFIEFNKSLKHTHLVR